MNSVESWQKNYEAFLPTGWRFEISKRGLYADWERECVFIPIDFDFNDESILRLMHEIGHAYFDVQRSAEDLEYECWLRDKVSMGFEELEVLEKEDYKRIVIAEEIKAWGFVLDRIEELKTKGLLSLNIGLDFVLELSRRKLATYQKMIDT